MATLTTADGLALHLHEWLAPNPRLVLMILHGYGEHAGRYAHVAQALNARGIAVLAPDLRGHGRSPGVRGYVERFRDYHQDADALFARARSLGAPVALLGHSMGGLVAIDWLLAGHGKELAGVVLSSPLLGVALQVHPVKATLGRVMSRLYPRLALPAGLQGKDVTRDPELARIYDADPLNNKMATARWFTEMNATVERALARAAELERPMLILYGGSDKVASADACDRFFARLRERPPQAELSGERLAGYYHEILNEPESERRVVIDRVATWLLARVEAKAA